MLRYILIALSLSSRGRFNIIRIIKQYRLYTLKQYNHNTPSKLCERSRYSRQEEATVPEEIASARTGPHYSK